MAMILFKLVLNLVFIFLGLCLVATGRHDYKMKVYPRWTGISEIIVGVLTSIASFTVWYVS